MSNVVERIKRILSYSEVEAFKLVVKELNGEKKKVIIASKLADKAGVTRSVVVNAFKLLEIAGVTRSVVVNAFKLLEIAGVIETRSLGMKGICISVIDQDIVNHIVNW